MNGVQRLIATLKADMAINSNPEITFTFEEARDVLAALASTPVAGEAQQPVALVEVSVSHLRSISVKIIPDAPMPNVGDLLYTTPQASEK